MRSDLLRGMRSQAGFTLIELLGVAVIIIILSVLALPLYAEVTDRVRTSRSSGELREIEGALERYKADTGHYPNRLELLITNGYLKGPHHFRSPWYSTENPAFYYYAVNSQAEGTAQEYKLGDPGPGANCGPNREARCGVAPFVVAPIIPGNVDALGLLGLRGSH